MNLNDHFEETLTPLLRLKPLFHFADGIFSPWERLVKAGKLSDITIHGVRSKLFYEQFLDGVGEFDVSDSAEQPVQPAQFIQNLGERIAEDTALLDRDQFTFRKIAFSFEGSESNLFIHRDANVSSMAFIDATEGPVVIDRNVSVSAFSLLKGPLYIGEGNQLDRVTISNTRTGKVVRLGGEISDSLIGNFSNKHHEGFLGHSIVGDWVNLGALTTTSDLKNNYGTIRLNFSGRDYSTETIKFGSIIGDYVKTGIGSMLNTGTIIDSGAQLFEGRPSLRYYPPFFWGGKEESLYEIDRFITDARKIMLRRKQELSASQEKLLRETFASLSNQEV